MSTENVYQLTFDVMKTMMGVLVLSGGILFYYLRKINYKNQSAFALIILGILTLVNVYVLKFYGNQFSNLLLVSGLLFGPLFYSFIRESVASSTNSLRSYWPHGMPAILLLLAVVFNVLGGKEPWAVVSVMLHFGAYLLMSGLLVFHNDRINMDREKGKFLKNLWVVLALAYLAIVFEALFYEPRFQFRYAILAIVASVLYLSIRWAVLKIRTIVKAYQEKKATLAVKKYKDSILTSSKSKDLANTLERYMTEEKPFLNDSIDLNSLASAIGEHPKSLSQAINENFNRNFFEYVNSFRIKEAQRMLADPEYNNHKIYEVMYAVGFNSRSSFNTAFKKMTGCTAKQFREEVIKNS